MDNHGVRYVFEHRLLPQWFYKDKQEFIAALLHDKSILYRIIDDIFTKEDMLNPYQPEQFDIEAGRIAEDLIMVKIIFPTPEDEPLCYCSYMLFDKDFKKAIYYCIERGQDDSLEYPFVCSWSEDMTHSNYGQCSMEDLGDFKRCLHLFLDEEYMEAETAMQLKSDESNDQPNRKLS